MLIQTFDEHLIVFYNYGMTFDDCQCFQCCPWMVLCDFKHWFWDDLLDKCKILYINVYIYIKYFAFI